MTLTVVVGASGSGKTTFLNDVHTQFKCIYIRQYHTIRPYITVSKIPNFEAAKLPYWVIYEKENKSKTIKVGGTMAGEFTSGLSGGQRKLLIFEIVVQRVKNHKSLLILLDEPFCGVTDDFVPFIVERLHELSQHHNVLLVTNDHVQTITRMAKNTITVSAVNRSIVQVNRVRTANREMTISALSIGDNYVHQSTNSDLKFFFTVEVWNNVGLFQIAIYTVFCFLFFVISFWNSKTNSAALILVGAEVLTYFCINPYILAFSSWRDTMHEESEALLHSSISTNNFLKLTLILTLMTIISLLEYGIINVIISGLSGIKFWIGILCDNTSGAFPLFALGLYTNLSFEMVESLGVIPYMLMSFFSTTYSPGSGLSGVKGLRYLFPRFYLWCMIPIVQDQMEGCPANETINLVYMILSSFLGVFIFLVYLFVSKMKKHKLKSKAIKLRKTLMKNNEFRELQISLYGIKVLQRFQHLDNSCTDGSST
jgi:ABC-type lipoprotein export system ATPase subunit